MDSCEALLPDPPLCLQMVDGGCTAAVVLEGMLACGDNPDQAKRVVAMCIKHGNQFSDAALFRRALKTALKYPACVEWEIFQLALVEPTGFEVLLAVFTP